MSADFWGHLLLLCIPESKGIMFQKFNSGKTINKKNIFLFFSYVKNSDLKKLKHKISSQYVTPTQFEKYMQSSNLTSHFLEELYLLKTNYMSKRNAKKYIEISSKFFAFSFFF